MLIKLLLINKVSVFFFVSWLVQVGASKWIHNQTGQINPCFTDTHLIETPHYYRQFSLSLTLVSHASVFRGARICPSHTKALLKTPALEASLALPVSLNLICLLQTPVITDTFCGPLSVCVNRVWLLKQMSVLEGQKKKEKRKKSVQFVSKADIIAIRINQTASVICNHICFNAHI